MMNIFNHSRGSIQCCETPLKVTCITVIACLLFSSCHDFVAVDPPRDQVIGATVFADDAAAISAIKGIYSEMVSGVSFIYGGNMTVKAGLSADELVNNTNTAYYAEFYQNALSVESSGVSDLWSSPYRCIYYANAVLEGLNQISSNVTEATKLQLEGEAKFIRAFCHFYLVNLFGEIPIVTTTDYRENRVLPKSQVSEVYDQIVADLIAAQDLLAVDYSYSNGERIRVNQWAARAMLARVYLYMENWGNAEAQATAIINNTADFHLQNDLDQVFLRNSEEAIWQLMSTSSVFNTREAGAFYSTPLADEMINAFEAGDERKNHWVDSTTIENVYVPYKYKVRVNTNPKEEYSIVLRLAEQYLIRAEARAEQNKFTEAIADVDAIRGRAGLALIANSNPAINKADLLNAILQERRVELFTERGHRWLDLKRTGRADAVLGPIKGIDWQSTDVLYPIPQTELENNPSLTPTPGY